MTSDRQRFVVTGFGAVSAWGWGAGPLWRGLLSGRTAIGPLGASPAKGTGPTWPRRRRRRRRGSLAASQAGRRLSLAERFALAAADEALKGAGGAAAVLGGAPEAVGVFFGGSTAGMLESEDALAGGAGRARACGRPLLAAQPLDAPAAAVARSFGLGGPVLTISSACASGTQALGAALDALRAGEVEVALAGGADSLCRLTYAGFNALRVVDERACRPFRDGRAGMTLGEGAGGAGDRDPRRGPAGGARRCSATSSESATRATPTT